MPPPSGATRFVLCLIDSFELGVILSPQCAQYLDLESHGLFRIPGLSFICHCRDTRAYCHADAPGATAIE